MNEQAVDQSRFEESLMRLTRERLKNKSARQHAVAMFPIQVANMAHDMSRMLWHQKEVDTPELQEAIDYLEERIREAYRGWFGAELGADGPAESPCNLPFLAGPLVSNLVEDTLPRKPTRGNRRTSQPTVES